MNQAKSSLVNPDPVCISQLYPPLIVQSMTLLTPVHFLILSHLYFIFPKHALSCIFVIEYFSWKGFTVITQSQLPDQFRANQKLKPVNARDRTKNPRHVKLILSFILLYPVFLLHFWFCLLLLLTNFMKLPKNNAMIKKI